VDFAPVTDAPAEKIRTWIDTIKNRCPINDNLSSPTPLNFNLTSVEVMEETPV
jgi:hypothetical protein